MPKPETYPDWKAKAGRLLQERHDINPAVIPEKVWRKSYTANETVDQAVEAAQVWNWNNNVRVKERARRKRR